MRSVPTPLPILPSLPARACNAHCHVIGPRARFLFPDGAAYVPAADAPREALYALNDRHGLQRCVVVQSSAHGFDNSAAAWALAGRPGHYRGIALLPTDVADEELRRLDRAGFCGVRFNFMAHLGAGAPVEDMLALAARFAPLGWHLQVHTRPDMLPFLGVALRNASVPVVIDHIGRIDASLGLQQPAFVALQRLMEDDRFWVKVSGIDRITKTGPPYADALPFAQQLVADHGERVVWGNDWPHPNHAEARVDDDLLLTLMAQIAPTDDARQRLLVDNPQRLYGFAP